MSGESATPKAANWRSRPLAMEAASRPIFWSHVNYLSDCWEWTGAVTTEWGYGRLRYSGHDFTAHRCSYEYAYGVIPDGLFVLHKCDNPPCVKPTHLFLGTAKDNTQDMLAKGRAARIGARGMANRTAKLTDSTVIEMRERYARGERVADLAAEVGIIDSYARLIIKGKAWAHVGGPICTTDMRSLMNKRSA